MKRPPRLIDDPEAGAKVRDDLQRASGAAVHYDVAAGLASLQAAIAAPPLPPAGAESAPGGAAATTGAAGTTVGATKLALGALGAAALIAGAVAVAVATLGGPAPALRGGTSVPRASAPARPAKSSAPAPAPAVAAVAPDSAEPAAEVSSGERLPPDPDGKLRREIAQVARIKALLPRNPGDAYRLAQQGNREFPHGVLVQEREGLAILSLAALGRRSEAERRAQAFLTRFPQSPLRERIAKIAAADRAP